MRSDTWHSSPFHVFLSGAKNLKSLSETNLALSEGVLNPAPVWGDNKKPQAPTGQIRSGACVSRGQGV